MAFQDVLGSSYDYQKTELGIQKRFWFSAFGYVDILAKAGKVWTKAPYPLLILPNANLSYLVQPESYTNMNAMEFIKRLLGYHKTPPVLVDACLFELNCVIMQVVPKHGRRVGNTDLF